MEMEKHIVLFILSSAQFAYRQTNDHQINEYNSDVINEKKPNVTTPHNAL